MPVCICGSHRTGTSMVARALNLAGLDLGPEDRLLPPTSSNREGHWESRPFVELNEAMLEAHGGSWDDPPDLPGGWEHDAAFRRRAEAIPGDLGLREPWGFKDPRTSLTLAFWRGVWPALRVVVSLRHPLEVAESYRARDGKPLEEGLGLWLLYNRALLEAVDARDLLVTHYDAYFRDAEAEVLRLARPLGLDASPATIALSAASVNAGIRNQRADERGDLPADVARLYDELCSLADGDGGAPPIDDAVRLEALRKTLERGRNELATLRAEVELLRPDANDAAALREDRAHLLAEISELRREAGVRAAQIEQLEAEVAWRTSVMERQEDEIAWRRGVMDAYDRPGARRPRVRGLARRLRSLGER